MFSQLLNIRSESPNDAHPFWYNDVYPYTGTGLAITPDSALSSTAVYGCVRVLAESCASLPLILYRRRQDGGKDRADDRREYELLHDQPNSWQTSFEFVELMLHHLALRGNSVNEVRFDRGGRAESIQPIHPDHIEASQTSGGLIRYNVRDPLRPQRRKKLLITGRDVLHVRSMSCDGIWGLNPIQTLRRAIGLPLYQDEFASRFFQQGVQPSGVYSHPTELSDKAFARLQQQMADHAGAHNSHRTLILEGGMEWKQVSMTNRDAQFLEARKFSIDEIARIFRIPPHMIQNLDKATFSNIEQQSIDFVVHSLRPWLVRIEQALKRDLALEPGLFAEFLVDGLLRGDMETRFAAYALAIQNEIYTPNEVRAMENRNPMQGGDELRNPITAPRQKPAESDAARLQAAFIDDVAGRIAAAELGELRKRAKHAAADSDRWQQWLSGYYEQHARYIDRAVAPLCDGLALRNVDRIAFVDAAVRQSCRTLLDGDPLQIVAGWDDGALRQRHANHLRELAA